MAPAFGFRAVEVVAKWTVRQEAFFGHVEFRAASSEGGRSVDFRLELTRDFH